MTNDYLWNGSGPPDPEIEALERLLAPLGQRHRPVPLPLRAPAPRPRRAASKLIVALAAAAILALAVAPLWLRSSRSGEGAAWQLVQVRGDATIASRAAAERSSLRVGQTLRTGSRGGAAIELADVGHVDVGPSTTVRLVTARAGHYRLRLDTGMLSAFIWATPGQFFVETPSSLAVDLGCAYTLHVDEHGAGLLHVTTGWVGFELRDRQALIPAGAMCATRAGVGPGTPYYEDAPAELRAALATIDFEAAPGPQRDAAIDRVLALARPHDALTLWHLLARVSPEQRGRVYDRLAALVPPPPGVTRDGVRAGDKRMAELWWDRLGLGSTDWWRAWSRPWTEPAR